MPKYFAHGGGDDLCWFEGEDYEEEYSPSSNRVVIALSSGGEGVTHINWVYSDNGCWSVFPSMVDYESPMVPGPTFTTDVSEEEEHSMRLTIDSPVALTVTEVHPPPFDKSTFDMSAIPFPKPRD